MSKVERDVFTMKRLMDLVDDDDDEDDMVVDDTPLKSLGDGPLPPPSSINLHPPPLLPSHPSPRTPSPPPNSPTQSDAAKEKETNLGDPWPIQMQIPQGTDSDIGSDHDLLNPRKRKASFLGGDHDVEAGSSYAAAASDPSASTHKKKSKLIFDLNELGEKWRIPIEEHLFHLRLEGLGHYERERGYHVLISLELSRRLDELKTDQLRWVNPKILKEEDKVYNGSSDDSREED
ncbi:unnamed protein product [Lactuca saligna]|uniref:Uncharacterized protein n=1 Tax=Lactuca saligna TaxID=75948 RepID=A0AA35YNU7_LACSI|nr:unnamed protein product [Lactuca saligna]